MDTEHRNTTVDADGKITVADLPFQEGDIVDVFILRRSSPKPEMGTAATLRSSSLVGLWSKRSELPDSPAFARSLREQAQRRNE